MSRRARSPWLPPIGHLAAVSLVAALAAWAGIELTRSYYSFAAIWFSNGILIALLLDRPRRTWPALIAAGLFGNIVVGQLTGDTLAQTAVLEGSNGTEILLAATLMRLLLGRNLDLTRWPTLAAFVPIAVVLAPLCSGLLAASALAVMWNVPFLHLLMRWYLGNALGIAVMTPLTLSLLRHDLKLILAPPFLWETLGVLAGYTLLAAIVFTSPAPLLFLLFPPLLLAVSRLGFAGAALLMLPTAVIAVAATAAGRGPLTLIQGSTLEGRLVYLQVFLDVLCATGWLIGVAVAERRRLRQALVDEHVRLARSERLYRLLADNSSDIIVRGRADGRRLYVSPSAKEVLGWTVEEMMVPDWMSKVHPDDLPICLRVRDRLLAGDTQTGATYRYRRKDGDWAWLEARAHVVPNPEGADLEFVVNIRDVSRQKQAELALESVMSDLAEQAATDPLTGIANRRTFERSLTMEWRRATRANDPLSLLLIDVDHFKAFNDLYGHQAGDECLRFVSSTIVASIGRAHDLVARYGGEEFVVMLPATDIDGAERTAETIRATIAARRVPHAASARGSVSISIGVACSIPASGRVPEALIEAADTALYSAKRHGRNRVFVARHVETEIAAAD